MRRLAGITNRMKKAVAKTMILGMTAAAVLVGVCGTTGVTRVEAAQAYDEFQNLSSGTTTSYKDMSYKQAKEDLANIMSHGKVLESGEDYARVRYGNRACEVRITDKKTINLERKKEYFGTTNFFSYYSGAEKFMNTYGVDGDIELFFTTGATSLIHMDIFCVTGSVDVATVQIKWFDIELNTNTKEEDIFLSNNDRVLIEVSANTNIDCSQIEWVCSSDCVTLYPMGDACYVEGNYFGTACITATEPGGVFTSAHVNVFE